MDKKQSLLKHYKNTGYFLKPDIIIAVLLIAAIVGSLISIFSKMPGATVEIYHKGSLEYTYYLSEDITIELTYEGKNTVIIHNGEVFMDEADCKDELCTKFSAISSAGQRIVCAPNGIVVLIKAKKDGLDGVTGGKA